MEKGKIFSIEEFSVFDGDGIRTTVFLKGCPLRCAWCHSPEGQSFATEYLRSPNGCLSCGQCLRAGEAATGERKLTEESVLACPRSLVRKCGEDMTSAEVAKRLLKNADVYLATGGGVTFSGGEPTAQPEFLLECLSLLKGKINRGLQTTGFCDPAVFKKIISECDLILFDIKLIDPLLHKKYTGASNEIILENFTAAKNSGAKLVVRTPLIPTVTDSAENVEGICAFLSEEGVYELEILPYNKMAGSKYKLAGKKWSPPYDESLPCEIRKEIYERYGIKYRIV
ncbi:MAG: glycyl-radical enzyme activating protein [Clostridia bacterium]|nr:glycyl-radical enzyme activating protein [Clostridia bacterium]